MIRIKLIIATILCVTLLTSVLYVVSTRILLKSYEEIEYTLMEENTIRVRGALQNYSDALNIKLRDWAQWDDTYQFITDGNDAYRESNLADTTLGNLEINFMAFFSSNGEVVFAKLIDLNEVTEIPSAALLTELMAKDAFMEDVRTHERISDIVTIGDQLLILEGLPILPTDGAGSPRGMLVFARFLDVQLVESLEELTQLPIDIYREVDIDSSQLSEVQTYLGAATSIHITPIDDRTVVGYFNIIGDGGESRNIVRVTNARDIYAQGVNTLSVLIPIAGLSILLFGLVILLFFEIILFRRFVRLNKEMASISMDNLKGAHVYEGRGKGDEIGTLAVRINKLLMEHSIAQEKEAETQERLKINLEQTEKINKLMIGRELKMIELKEKIKQLSGKVGEETSNNS